MVHLRPITLADTSQIEKLVTSSVGHPLAMTIKEKLSPSTKLGRNTTAIVAELDGKLVGVGVVSDRWCRWLLVHPEYRKHGIGTKLLHHLESIAKRTGATSFRTCDEPGNYVTPGIPCTDTQIITWFTRRGYKAVEGNTNLIATLNDKVSESHILRMQNLHRDTEYIVQRCNDDARDQIIAEIAEQYSKVWAYESSLAQDNRGLFVAMHGQKFVGFSAHSGNNSALRCFGPSGVAPAHQGKGLGQWLLLTCLYDLKRLGQHTCEIAWIGPREFYEKCVDITSERSFQVLAKNL